MFISQRPAVTTGPLAGGPRTSVLGAALAVACLAGAAPGCGHSENGDPRELLRDAPTGSVSSPLTGAERKLVGLADDYPADPSLATALPALRLSQAERRRRAWEVVARVLAPVSLDTDLPQFAGRPL